MKEQTIEYALRRAKSHYLSFLEQLEQEEAEIEESEGQDAAEYFMMFLREHFKNIDF